MEILSTILCLCIVGYLAVYLTVRIPSFGEFVLSLPGKALDLIRKSVKACKDKRNADKKENNKSNDNPEDVK